MSLRDIRKVDDKEREYHELIKSYFADYEKPTHSKFSFKASFQGAMNKFIEQLFHIIVNYFGKYSEQEFHDRMNQSYTFEDKVSKKTYKLKGFDFVADWRQFHKPAFITATVTVQSNKWWLKFDEAKIYDIITKLLEAKGWKIEEHEYKCININVRRLHNMFFKLKDTVEKI